MTLENKIFHELLWVREPFMSSNADLALIIVHGHNLVTTPLLRCNRIALDTGDYFGGELTCAALEDDRIDFLQA